MALRALRRAGAKVQNRVGRAGAADEWLETKVSDLSGLRERKKARTHEAIQEAALRLFRTQGYEATTVEQIAEAAEVSPSTFFRYFPTKEDVVIHDALDPLLFASFAEQPAQLSPIQALRASMAAVFGALSPDQLALEFERQDLIVGVPELRARMLDDLATTFRGFAEALAARVGRPADDLAVRAFAGAVLGAGIAVWLTASQGEEVSVFMKEFDAAMAYLDDSGLRL
jgi:AcrR family transcriptional regulator